MVRWYRRRLYSCTVVQLYSYTVIVAGAELLRFAASQPRKPDSRSTTDRRRDYSRFAVVSCGPRRESCCVRCSRQPPFLTFVLSIRGSKAHDGGKKEGGEVLRSVGAGVRFPLLPRYIGYEVGFPLVPAVVTLCRPGKVWSRHSCSGSRCGMCDALDPVMPVGLSCCCWFSDFGMMVFRSRFFLARNGPISACCRPGETLAGQAGSVFSSEKLPKRTQWVVKSEKPGSNQYREHVISRWKQTISKHFQGCKHSQPCHKSENPVFSASKSHGFSFFTRRLPPPRKKLETVRLY